MRRLNGLMGIALLALTVGAPDAPPDYEAIRRRRLERLKRDLIAEGMTEDEAAAEVDRLDVEALHTAGGSGCDWSWALDIVLETRLSRRRQAATPVVVIERHSGACAEVGIDIGKLPDPSRATAVEVAAAADPPGSLTVDDGGRVCGPPPSVAPAATRQRAKRRNQR